MPKRKWEDPEIGKTFGTWTVISYAGKSEKTGADGWWCQCQCGKKSLKCRSEIHLKRSCGSCWQIKHGGRREKHAHFLYDTWAAMKARCFCKTNKAYKWYGARGITVCEKWIEFSNFRDDMEATWRPTLSLGRIDNNGPYSRDNCRWETMKEQSSNRRSNRLITHSGKTQTMQQWLDELGLSNPTVYSRIKRGWPQEKWLNTDHFHVKTQET